MDAFMNQGNKLEELYLNVTKLEELERSKSNIYVEDSKLSTSYRKITEEDKEDENSSPTFTREELQRRSEMTKRKTVKFDDGP